MEIWIPLLSALVGGLIAVVPVLITLRNQSVERERDRREQKREARTQLEIELVRNDINVIDEMINKELKLLFFYGSNKLRNDISDDERMEIMTSFRRSTAPQLVENRTLALVLSLSLGQEISKR